MLLRQSLEPDARWSKWISATFRFHSLLDIPWLRLDTPQTRTVPRRYVTERVQHRFRVHVGGAQTGRVVTVSSELAPISNEEIDGGHLDTESRRDW